MNAATITQPVTTVDEPASPDRAARAVALRVEPPPPEPIGAMAPKTTPMQQAAIALGTLAFLYFARPVVLPMFMAFVAAMTLKPLIRCSVPSPTRRG